MFETILKVYETYILWKNRKLPKLLLFSAFEGCFGNSECILQLHLMEKSKITEIVAFLLFWWMFEKILKVYETYILFKKSKFTEIVPF